MKQNGTSKNPRIYSKSSLQDQVPITPPKSRGFKSDIVFNRNFTQTNDTEATPPIANIRIEAALNFEACKLLNEKKKRRPDFMLT